MTEAANGAAFDTLDERSVDEGKLAISEPRGEKISEEAIREALSRIL